MSYILDAQRRRELLQEGITEAVRPYANGKSEMVAGVVVETGSRFVDWFFSTERVALRRDRRRRRRERRKSR